MPVDATQFRLTSGLFTQKQRSLANSSFFNGVRLIPKRCTFAMGEFIDISLVDAPPILNHVQFQRLQNPSRRHGRFGIITAIFALTCYLLACGDIEANPGPIESHTASQPNRGRQDHAHYDNPHENRTDYGFNWQALVDTVWRNEQAWRQCLQEQNLVGENVQSLTVQVSLLTDELDRLEALLRKDNLKVIGIAESPDEFPEVCAQKVIDALNLAEQSTDTLFLLSDIQHTHRIGSNVRHYEPRPIIVKLVHSRDKLRILRNQELRANLRRNGIKVANDLTRRQSAQLAELRSQGLRGYFLNGKLKVEDNLGTHRSQSPPLSPGGDRRHHNLRHDRPTHHGRSTPHRGNGQTRGPAAGEHHCARHEDRYTSRRPVCSTDEPTSTKPDRRQGSSQRTQPRGTHSSARSEHRGDTSTRSVPPVPSWRRANGTTRGRIYESISSIGVQFSSSSPVQEPDDLIQQNEGMDTGMDYESTARSGCSFPDFEQFSFTTWDADKESCVPLKTPTEAQNNAPAIAESGFPRQQEEQKLSAQEDQQDTKAEQDAACLRANSKQNPSQPIASSPVPTCPLVSTHTQTREEDQPRIDRGQENHAIDVSRGEGPSTPTQAAGRGPAQPAGVGPAAAGASDTTRSRTTPGHTDDAPPGQGNSRDTDMPDSQLHHDTGGARAVNVVPGDRLYSEVISPPAERNSRISTAERARTETSLPLSPRRTRSASQSGAPRPTKQSALHGWLTRSQTAAGRKADTRANNTRRGRGNAKTTWR